MYSIIWGMLSTPPGIVHDCDWIVIGTGIHNEHPRYHHISPTQLQRNQNTLHLMLSQDCSRESTNIDISF